VLIISGATGKLLRSLPPPDTTSNRRFATSVSGMEDIDGDGRGDLVVGAPTAALTFLDTGAAFIFSGATGTLLRTLQPLPPPAPAKNGDLTFGSRVLGTPDLDGDGAPDALVAGKGVTVISGATGLIIRVIPGFLTAGGFGQALAVCPDADGDGVAGSAARSPNADVPISTRARPERSCGPGRARRRPATASAGPSPASPT
jgi:hypothetical protein